MDWQYPVARLTTVVASGAAGHLPLPVPLQPGASSSQGEGGAHSTAAAAPEVLQGVASALLAAEVSYL